MKAEIQRRASLRDQLKARFLAQPGVWISMAELAQIGGVGGWRTRVSELGRKDGLQIEWNGKNGAASCHRLVPSGALGREADQIVVYADSHLGPLFDRAGAFQKER